MPENICNALNPNDPSRAEAILSQELENIYQDLQKSFDKNKKIKDVGIIN
jgi:DNA-binding GntR family transcriptional regulator